MQFSVDEYLSSKKTVIDMIKKTHDWEKTEGFVVDGVNKPELYATQKVRIACFLSETYGYDECGAWENEEGSDWGLGNPKVKTVKRLGLLIWLIQQYTEAGCVVRESDMPRYLSHNEESIRVLKDSLDKIAWVNVKKASRRIENWGNGATNQNYREVYEHAVRNRDILREQISSMKPHIMILCGKPVFNGLYDSALLGEGVVHQKNKVQINTDGQKIIETSHPGYHRDWGYSGIYKTFERICFQ